MDILTASIVSSVAFGRILIGLILRPYETYRTIAGHSRWRELYSTGLLIGINFAIASVVKVAAFRPFLLTRQFVILWLAALGSYAVIVSALWFAGAILKVRIEKRALMISWGYTLLPTVIWFLVTSILYVILPPPRTTSFLGIAFSAFFIIFSVTLLWWKIMLSYLTVRFVLKVDLQRSIVACAIVLPVAAAYSVLMYYWGIFKVPFI